MKTFKEWLELTEEIGKAGQYKPNHGGYPGTVQVQPKAKAYDQYGKAIPNSDELIGAKTRELGRGNVSVATNVRSQERKGAISRVLFGPRKVEKDKSAGVWVGYDGKGNRQDLEAPEGGRMYYHPDDAPGSTNQQMVRSGLRKQKSSGLEQLGYQ